MLTRGRLFRGGLLLALGVSVAGCPVTDNYFIDANQALNGGAGDVGTSGTSATSAAGGNGVTPEGGKAQAGSAQGGNEQGGSTAAAGTSSTGGSAGASAGDSGVAIGGATDVPVGGAAAGGQTGDAGAGGVPPSPCVPRTERCNGVDDNCNDSIDELVCNSSQNGTSGCFGFVIAGYPDHGYMLCTSNNRNYGEAKQVCAGQDMRLAWLESAEENNAVALKVASLTNATDVLIGATDSVTEGYWFWDGGFQFWKGAVNGAVVNGSFEAWASTAPDNGGFGGNEDCGVITPKTGMWGDRSCNANSPFLCEDKN